MHAACILALAGIVFVIFKSVKSNGSRFILQRQQTASNHWLDVNLKLFTLVTAPFPGNTKGIVSREPTEGQVGGGVLHPQKENFCL